MYIDYSPPVYHFLKGLRKAEGSTEKMQHFVKIREQSIQTQQQEIAVSPPQSMWPNAYFTDLHVLSTQNYKEEAKKQRQLIQALERERDRYGKDAAEAQQSCISQVS